MAAGRRYCGECYASGRGFSPGANPLYLREMQNEPRADLMAAVSAACATAAGFRVLHQVGCAVGI